MKRLYGHRYITVDLVVSSTGGTKPSDHKGTSTEIGGEEGNVYVAMVLYRRPPGFRLDRYIPLYSVDRDPKKSFKSISFPHVTTLFPSYFRKRLVLPPDKRPLCDSTLEGSTKNVDRRPWLGSLSLLSGEGNRSKRETID